MRATFSLRQRGTALIIVLASLVLLATLAVAFLSSIGTELKSSQRFADGLGSEVLAQSAYNLVTDQILEATKGYAGDDPAEIRAWASQPGMIRTYDSTGAKSSFFRLYSWNELQGSGSFDASTDALKLKDWDTSPALFTDLNQPVRMDGELHFPILSGNDLVDGSGWTAPVPGLTYRNGTANSPAIDGFYISGAPSNAAQPVPMPVKWLYLLADGKIVPGVATGNTREALVQVDSNNPSLENPIVGRIAFWTDDESAKINVNTSSEGVYWDTPRAVSKYEDELKTNQPVTGEYQRYPGHPATTSLSTVLKRPASSTLTDAEWARYLYGLVPRIKDGGSQAGTTNTAWAPTSAPVAIEPDGDRLYASVDELTFNPARDLNDLKPSDPVVLSQENLNRARFFLTASSRAPDLNLFNLPRVSIWPMTLPNGTARPLPTTTAFDDLIAFCSTMRPEAPEPFRFYFQRKDQDSPTVDLPENGSIAGLGRNRMLLEYLRNLTSKPLPGFGGSFEQKYGADRNQILTQIFDYIRGATNLMDSNLKIGTDRSKFTTYTPGIPNAGTLPWRNRLGEGQVVPIDDLTNGTHGFGRYQTVQGASILFIGQIDGDDEVQPPAGTETSQVDLQTGLALPANLAVAKGHMRVRAIFLPQFFCPAVGAPWNIGNFQWSVDLSGLRWGPNNTPMNFPPASDRHNQNQKSEDETGFGDQYGLRQVVQGGMVLSEQIDLPKGPFSFSGGEVTLTIYAADRVAAPPASSVVVQTIKMQFEPGEFPMPQLAPNRVYKWNNGNRVKEPNPDGAGNIEVSYNYRSFVSQKGNRIYNSADPTKPSYSFGGRPADPAGTWILDEDVIRSVGVNAGDTRLVAAMKNVPTTMFQPNAMYSSQERVRGAHHFFDAYGRPYYGAALGRLVKGINYLKYAPSASVFPGVNELNKVGPNSFNLSQYTLASDIPLDGVAVGLDRSVAPGDVLGDWDNGPFDVRDGPFINKPDEGDRSSDKSIDPYEWKLKAKAGGSIVSSLFTPNREIASAVTFGSLPTGVFSNRPWQTLLFRPEPGHPGSQGMRGDGTTAAGMPADHLLLDLFHMPVVEPYAISEPLSTAGRINMNYQVVPFTYINRDTGIRALLKSEKVVAISESQPDKYKLNAYKAFSNPPVREQFDVRFDINMEETLKGFTDRFLQDKDLFRSASEICTLPMVPIDPKSADDTYAGMAQYWAKHRLTGDNSKERIYATLYPRLTTKSNTYTIHVRVQTLRKAPGGPPTIWREGKDQITGEYRGSRTIERYVNPSDSRIVDYADPGSASAATPIGDLFKARVVATKKFTP